MEQTKDLAIVLRSVAYEERHKVVTALTENYGRVSALARNAIQSRRFGGTLEPFAAAEWRMKVRPGADLLTLEGAEIRRSFEGLRKSFEALSLASAFNEIMLRIAPEREPCPDLFKLHANALAHLDETAATSDSKAWVVLLNGYLTKVLQWNGSQPRLIHCLGCDQSLQDLNPEVPVRCAVQDAGWVCESCGGVWTARERGEQALRHSLMRLMPAALVDFHLCQMSPIKQIASKMVASEEEHRELFAFLESLLVYHVPGFDRTPLKSLRFLGLGSTC